VVNSRCDRARLGQGARVGLRGALSSDKSSLSLVSAEREASVAKVTPRLRTQIASARGQ
jgi:hypothetical protein